MSSTAHGVKLVTLEPGSGYGNAGVEYLLGLDRLGVPVTWTPITDGRWGRGKPKAVEHFLPGSYGERLEKLRGRSLPYDVLLLDFPPPGWHRRWARRERPARPFAYAAWEADRLPDDWVPVMNSMHAVFVPSRHNREVFTASGVTVPVEVVPHVAREAAASDGPVDTGWGRVEPEDYVFYTIGTWETRKALEQTIRTFLDTFTVNDPVALIVKTSVVDEISVAAMAPAERQSAPDHLGTTWWALARILRDYSKPAKVHLVAGAVPAGEIERLHRRGDCFLLLSRGEGWGLGAFEAAIFGNPSIATGWGGHLDYLGGDYPLLVDYVLEAAKWSPRDDYFPDWSASWARPDFHQASERMRWVFDHREQAAELGSVLGSRIRSQYSSERVCRGLASLLGFELS